MKKVTEYIEGNSNLLINKIAINMNPNLRNTVRFSKHIQAAVSGLCMRPDVAILDTYGEASLLLWLLLRTLRPSTKIITVFHHYEPLIVRRKISKFNIFFAIYNMLNDELTKLMLKNSDNILTVSETSRQDLQSILPFTSRYKISVVGASSDVYLAEPSCVKDIDFLCVGRIEKFAYLERIWMSIKTRHKNAKFVMIGRASSSEISKLNGLGIEHLGIVSEEKKMELYSRAYVLVFPSAFEGFGIAPTEALSAGLTIVAWKLPVFEERFSNMNSVKLVDMGEVELFAHISCKSLDERRKNVTVNSRPYISFQPDYTWEQVGQRVLSVLVEDKN
jgi:glycosyltransferase involved in cell wall biosynthesis